MIGRVISGRYVVEAVVGTGGMAVVYRAYDKIKKQTVAIKVLRPEYEKDAEFVRRFSREAEAASKVSHENIVNMFDVGNDGGVRYIVMEFVDGQTLKEMIREQGRILPDMALRMTIRILAAVDHAHRNGIVHRDIKPQNILVDRHGRVKVADFGIARLKASQTTRVDGEGGASALGSVHYFSPEQARGEVADEKSDLYSVGIVLYEMLTGQVPFDGETSVSVAIKHLQEEPKSMRLLQEGISKALDEVTMRALVKDTAMRYQTAAEMAADLRKTISHPRGGFVKYPQENEDEDEKQKEARRKKRQKRKRRAIVASVLALLVLMLAAAGWYFLFVYEHAVVPSVIGVERTTARAMLEDCGLTISFDSAYNEEVESGHVISQSTDPGKRLRLGSNVEVLVSAGSEWFYMDSLVGTDEATALSILARSGAKNYRVEYVQSDDFKIGTVVAQSLKAGYQNKKETVVLTVSGKSVSMPSLMGLSLEGAQALIEAEGLRMGTVTEGNSPDAPSNTVISQSIEPNTQVLVNTAINLTVSHRDERMYYPQSRFMVAVPLENLNVEITLRTPSGTEVVAYREELSMGTHPVDLASPEAGRHMVRVYLDGVMMDSTELVFD